MEHIDPELLKRLDQLAAKLGVAASFLWHALIRQAYINAAENLVVAIILAVAALYLFRLSIVLWNWSDGHPNTNDTGLGAGLVFFVGLVAAGFAITCICDTVDGFLNPGYAALGALKSLL